MPPAFTKLIGITADADGITIIFLGEDGQQYSWRLATNLVGELLGELQASFLQRGQGRAMTTVTVLGHQPLMNATSKGLALQTREAGTIAFHIPDEMFPGLRSALAALEASVGPSTKQ